jgi:hypothetical protein
MAGEFVRTPKKGIEALRYRTRADLPLVEIGLCLFSLGSVVASLRTGHWFAAPFAMLFTFGYGYVATLVASEQLEGRRAAAGVPSEPVGDEIDGAVISAQFTTATSPEKMVA